MKKLVILAVALSAAVMYSCKKGSGDLGLAQSGGLKQYMMM